MPLFLFNARCHCPRTLIQAKTLNGAARKKQSAAELILG